MKRKKIIAIMMASAMLCSIATGCNKDKKEQEDHVEKETTAEETKQETNETCNHEDNVTDDAPATDIDYTDIPEEYFIDGKYVICPASPTGSYEFSGYSEKYDVYPNGEMPDYYYEEYADTEYLDLAIEYSAFSEFYDYDQSLQYDGYTYMGIEINNEYYFLTEGFMAVNDPDNSQICEIVYVTKIPEEGLQHVMDIESMTETDYGYEITAVESEAMNQITYEWHRDSQLLINHFTVDTSCAVG